MSGLCSAYLGGRSFNLPKFGSKREEKKGKQDELYGFFPKKGEEGLHRTGTLPVRIKPEADARQQQRAAQKLIRHRSLLPAEKSRNVVCAEKKPVLPPRCPLQVQIPKNDPAGQGGQRMSFRRMVPPVPTQQQQQQLSPVSPSAWCSPISTSTKLNSSLNSSGNSLDDSGIDSCGDSTRHTLSTCGDQASRVSFSSHGSMHPSPKSSQAVYDINWKLQGASINRPANIPLWVRRDFQPSSVEKAKMRVITARRGDIVNALYRTNEWVMVCSSKEQTGFIPFAYTEPLDESRLSKDFTWPQQRRPELSSAPLWRPTKQSLVPGANNVSSNSAHTTDNESMHSCATDTAPSSSIDSGTSSPAHRPANSGAQRRYDPDMSVLEDCANVEFFHRLARDRNPVIMSSQLSMIPAIGSDVSCDVSCVSYDVSYEDGDDDYVTDEYTDDDVNSLDVSIDSTCTESSVFTVTDTGIQLTVLFNYRATQENDISVDKGDIVLEMNTDDPDWTWVRKEDSGEEGFVPATYVVNLRKLNLDPRAPTTYL